MNNEIPAIFWMVIISVLSALLAFILYQLGMLLRESTETVKETTNTVRKSNEILDEAGKVIAMAKDSASTVKDTVSELNQAILVPARSIGSVLHAVVGFANGLRGIDETEPASPRRGN